MIIPIRCFSCNNVIASKWIPYVEKVKEIKKDMTTKGQIVHDGMQYLTTTTVKSAEGRALDELGVTRMCCRTHLLTHVDLI
jgi:DNA-directed RNA polymerase I, II, and III subunit RPABC5